MRSAVSTAAYSALDGSAYGKGARVPSALAPKGEDGSSNPASGGDVRNAVVEGGPGGRTPLRMPPSRALGNSVSFVIPASVPDVAWGQGGVDNNMGLNLGYAAD